MKTASPSRFPMIGWVMKFMHKIRQQFPQLLPMMHQLMYKIKSKMYRLSAWMHKIMYKMICRKHLAILINFLKMCEKPKSIIELANLLGYKDRRSVRKLLNPLLEIGRIAMTVPDKPNSKNQKYITIK